MNGEHPIPPMTDPLGAYWEQPGREAILVDGTHAVMTQRTFDALAEYSSTYPTGVYPGKMWRRDDGAYDPRPGRRVWLLCWYGLHADPGRCSINFREILIV